MHTLGAVQPSAPHFSGGAHCYELYDVMCYTPMDGTPDVFLRTCDIVSEPPNPGKPLDCGSDDYFNASPATGSYLDTHWDLYDSGFLCALARCDRAPAAPVARLAVVAGDGQSVTVSAASSSDPDGAVVSYVWDLDGDGIYDSAGPAARTVAVAGRGPQLLTVAAVDDDNLVAAATITVDEHSLPGQVGTALPSPVTAASAALPQIVVQADRVVAPARLRLTVGRRVGLDQVRARGLRVTVGASRGVRVDVALRRGTRLLTRRGLTAAQHARRVTLRLSQRQLRDLGRRRATTLAVEISAAGSVTLRRRIVVVRAA
jgi:hypothetical protein